MANKKAKRGPGRPRNAAVDKVAAELGITTRRVRQLQQAGELPPTGTTAPTAPTALPGTAGMTLSAKARLKRALVDLERAEIALDAERLEARRLKGELMAGSDAIQFCLTSLESTTAALRNAGHRYASRANPGNPEVGRRAIEALVCEVGQVVRDALGKLKPSPI